VTRPLGTVTVVSGPSPCGSEQCYEVDITCPGVAAVARATIRVGDGSGAARGTIVFFSGGLGTGEWTDMGADAVRVVSELRGAGYRTVQVVWSTGWLAGDATLGEGQGKLACRPATVARWVFDNLHQPSDSTAYCATGQSGGAAQLSYLVSQYGLADLFAVVMPTGGPPMGRLDRGCIRDNPADSAAWFDAAGAGVIDLGFGAAPGAGPCSQRDTSFRARFSEASVAFGAWDYTYPNTMVWFLHGGLDDTNGPEQGDFFRDRLVLEGQTLLMREIVPGTPHPIASTAAGADKVRDVLLAECRP
jgi:hypothetical protein